MCDYSLMSVPNRLARDGEELVTHRFESGTIGLASHADLHPKTDPMPPRRWTFWSAMREALTPSESRSVPAVCIPPGARLLLQDIPERLQQQLDVGSVEEVIFVEQGADAFRYRDAVRFGNGREILLQQLACGQAVQVLSPDSAESEQTQRQELGELAPVVRMRWGGLL